ncbi:MAG: hypothetical protein IJR61_03845 [Clostridia bacterium]|nr:hypothetical protein [Clostridia bacterium]
MDVTAVIDVGSNSVRLGVFRAGKAEYKTLITSRLGEGVTCGNLNENAVNRTINAIAELKDHAFSLGAGELYAFATEAVRRAENGADFVKKTLVKTGVCIYIASGEEEASLAVEGALGGKDGAVIDLGGASTEVAVSRGGKIVYSHSLPVGAVVLKDICGADEEKLTAYIAKKTAEYGNVPTAEKVYAVGGTATSIAACAAGLEKYEPEKVHGTNVSVLQIDALAEKLKNLTAGEIAACYPVDGRRAEIIFGGALLMKGVLSSIGAGGFTASESDNLEGFYNMLKSGKIKAAKIDLRGGK